MAEADARGLPLLGWIEHNTSADDVFLAPHPYALYLYTGRQSAKVTGTADSAKVGGTADVEELLSRIERAQVDYVVFNPSHGRVAGKYYLMGETVDLRPVIEKYPQNFTPVFQMAEQPWGVIYRLGQ